MGRAIPPSFKAMSEEQLKAFQEAVKADAELQEKLKAAADADAVVEIAKAAGFVISAEQLMQLASEISEDNLSNITGGLTTIDHLRNFGTAIFT